MKRGRVILLTCLCWAGPELPAQIVVPDRLPDGRRMSTVVTPADKGTLAYDSLRTLPPEEGGRDTWWHRHALHMEGPISVTLDPLVSISRDMRSTTAADGISAWEQGHRNIRGVRYSGTIDDQLQFGGKVLEMQRLLTGPEAEYVLAAQEFPGMGTGKLRPAENGLHSIDHSLAEVWFDLRPHDRWHIQWGLGSTGMGPGARNILWNGNRTPAPFLLVEADLGKGWTWRWVQSRQRGRERLPADGAREGRYAPLGLGMRSLTKTIRVDDNAIDVSLVSVRWTDVTARGVQRPTTVDWMRALGPWHWPGTGDMDSPRYNAGHWGLDLQWRRPQSTWYGQLRLQPMFDGRMEALVAAGETDAQQWMVGHVRHGQHLTIWTEWAPTAASRPGGFDPLLPANPLGIQDASPWRNSFIQGAEIRSPGIVLAAETGMLGPDATAVGDAGQRLWSHKLTIELPSRAADPGTGSSRALSMKTRGASRILPPLVPIAPFASVMHIPGLDRTWWSVGLTTPFTSQRKTH